MSNLIERAQAIGAVDVYLKRLCNYIGTPEDTELYALERGLLTSVKIDIGGLPSAQLSTNLAEVGTSAVRGYPIDADALMAKVAEEYGERARDTLYRIIKYMPPAQPTFDARDTQYNLPIGTDLISRAAAIDALRKMQTYKLFSGDDMLLIDQAGAQTELMLLPSAEPDHIKGKWLPYKYAMPGKEYKFHVCSVCGVCDEYVVDVPRPNGTVARLESVRNFCPNCGAKMERRTDG